MPTKCVPFILHQMLMFWNRGTIETIWADHNPFQANVQMVETLFYSPWFGTIKTEHLLDIHQFTAFNLTEAGFQLEDQSFQVAIMSIAE